MSKVLAFLKKEMMLTFSLLAAVVALVITPPSKRLLASIDWRTLGTLLMMLCVLEGFKAENVLRPLVLRGAHFRTIRSLSLFLVFGVFFSSMFVTNDVSLIIFVPITILLFRQAGQEKYILPVISLENIAAIRGSLLTPFGSPQNLFLYSQSQKGVGTFLLHMAPLCLMSAVLLVVFIVFLYRKEDHLALTVSQEELLPPWEKDKKKVRLTYMVLFVLILFTILSRTDYWPLFLVIVMAGIALVSPGLFWKVDYVLLLTFFCFFVFSSSITAHEGIAGFLEKAVAGREYWWALGLSQIISNVPASIVLYPFTENFAGLIYGADTAGLLSLIGSLASVINYRLYVREYPDQGRQFIKTFTLISWAFFAFVVIPGYLLSFWPF